MRGWFRPKDEPREVAGGLALPGKEWWVVLTGLLKIEDVSTLFYFRLVQGRV